MKKTTFKPRSEDQNRSRAVDSACDYLEIRLGRNPEFDEVLLEVAAVTCALMSRETSRDEREAIADTIEKVTTASLHIGDALDDFEETFDDTEQQRLN